MYTVNILQNKNILVTSRFHTIAQADKFLREQAKNKNLNDITFEVYDKKEDGFIDTDSLYSMRADPFIEEMKANAHSAKLQQDVTSCMFGEDAFGDELNDLINKD